MGRAFAAGVETREEVDVGGECEGLVGGGRDGEAREESVEVRPGGATEGCSVWSFSV